MCFIAGNLDRSGKYSNAKRLKVAKNKVKLSAGKSYTIKAKTVMVKAGKAVLNKSHAKVYRYLTTDSAVAKVNSAGRITARGSGSCSIYVCAQNGVSVKIDVVVK